MLLGTHVERAGATWSWTEGRNSLFNLRSSVEENYLPARATTVSSIGFTLTNNFITLLSQWLTLIRIKQ